ncbi:MAG: hypothetical protein EPO26_16275 [Chloroflexota bacterium]|nr:MAG: hypothetical protein EPO26_16275 [Chloroflexota bacterium]
MGRAFRAYFSGLADTYGELFPVVGMNVLWIALSTPLLALGAVFILVGVGVGGPTNEMRDALQSTLAILLIVALALGPNPAAAGIYLWANYLVRDERVEFSLVWRGLREYWWPAAKLFGISVIGYALLIANAAFYLASDQIALKIFGIVWIYAIYFWTSMQMYQLPLLIEQDDKRVRLVLRNAFFLAFANVLDTLALTILVVVTLALSLVIAILIALVAGAMIAIVNTRATHLLLERHRPATT